MQGAQILRNKAYLAYAAWAKDAVHKSAGQPICMAEGSPEGVASKDGRHAHSRWRLITTPSSLTTDH